MKGFVMSVLAVTTYITISAIELDENGSLKIINGTCFFRKANISDHKTFISEIPCERWWCYANISRVVIQGCPPPSYFIPYLNYPGAWPFCCSKKPE
uniref:8.9 kDa family member n=1 Tax=Rhipicephalus zambeziensis TaxID=60191 RepID=A0A224Y7W1_9ACAR